MRVRFFAVLGVIAVVSAVVRVLVVSGGPEQAEEQPGRPRIWSFDMRDLYRVEIALNDVGLSEAWFRTEDRVWYFDRPDRPRVDMDRWGGGVPFLLSAPRATRIIADDIPAQDLVVYGLDQPRMSLHLEHGEKPDVVDVIVGDQTPDGISYYLQLIGTGTVYTVDHTWYDIMERLVLEPPYLPDR